MKKSYLTMLEANEGMILKRGNTYTSSVILRKEETEDGWEEITQEEYKQIMNTQKDEEVEV